MADTTLNLSDALRMVTDYVCRVTTWFLQFLIGVNPLTGEFCPSLTPRISVGKEKV
jgi:hypothetical protein